MMMIILAIFLRVINVGRVCTVMLNAHHVGEQEIALLVVAEGGIKTNMQTIL